MLRNIRSMFKGQKGQGFVEYGLALAIIVIIVVAAFKLLGSTASSAISKAGSRVSAEA